MVGAGTVEAIVAEAFPGAEIEAVTDVSGGVKATYVVSVAGEEVVVSICGPGCDEAGFAVEPAVMELVARETDVPVPAVLASDRSKDRHPFMYHVTRRVEGYDPADRYKYLPRGEREALLERAGAVLGSLHRGVGFDVVGPLRPDDGALRVEGAESWPAFLESMMRGWIDRLDGGRFADLRPTFERVAGRCGRYAPTEVEATLCHSDYRPANLLVRDGDVAAVVDWGLSVSGHAEYDLFKAEKNFLLAHFETPEIRDALREPLFRGYRREANLAPGWRDRRAFYRTAYKLESLRSFDRWTAGMTPGDRDEMASRLRRELADDLDRLESGADRDPA